MSGPTTEGGGTATFTVVLTSQPVGDVTLTLDSDNSAEGTASPTSLTFTAGTTGNWATPQTVTLTGVDDSVADGSQTYHVVFNSTQSTDTAYAAILPASIDVINVDNDSVGFVQTPISGDTSEDGTSATFTVALSSQPSADVTVNLSSDNTNEGTVSAGSLTFTGGASGNWATPQTVTVTGVNDANADGAKTYHVVFAATTSADATYAAIKPANVTLINHDNDPIATYNFDSGLQGWTVFGLWNDDATPATVDGTASFHSSPNSLNYNNGTDFAGTNSGTATSPTINLSPYGNPTLTFWCLYQTETVYLRNYDRRVVQISNDGFATLLVNQQLSEFDTNFNPTGEGPPGSWHQHTLALNPNWGTVQIRFFFDTVDSINNNYPGWFLDDVVVASP